MTNLSNLRRWPLAAMLLLASPFLAAQEMPADILTVQEVQCAGNTETSCEFIRGHLYLEPGQILDEEEVRNAELRLSSLRNFKSVSIRLEKGAQRGAVIVVIGVEEASPITTEWLLGASLRDYTKRTVFAGRVAHKNLFGEGKLADFTVVAITPFDHDPNNESYSAALRYVDPHLFGSARYFASVTAGVRRSRSEDAYGNFNKVDVSQLDVRVGWRFADFSYLMLGARARHNLDWTWGRWHSDGTFELKDARPNPVNPTIAYGWSSEDDLYFPTQGSSFQLAAGSDGSPIQFRKTWPMLGALWTFKFGGDPSPEYRGTLGESQLLGLTYSRSVAPGAVIQRGRWYIEPGLGFQGYTSDGAHVYEYGIKAGFRAETRLFGVVDFYVLGTRDWVR